MMRRVLLSLLLVAVPATGLFAAAKPWRFEPGEKAAAERTYGMHTWNRHYTKALEMLEDGGATDLDEVIAILKLAIDMKGRSELGVVVKRMPIDYFPYYLLAEAYARKGDARAAQECLEKESAGLVRQSPTLGAKYTALAGSITALVSKDDVLARARSVLGWRGTETAVILGSGYQQAVAGIEGMVGNVESAGPQELQSQLDGLSAALLDVCRNGVSAQASRIDELGTAPWSVPGLGGACKAIGRDTSAAAVQAAITTVEGCVQAVATGLRTAGRKACGEIDGLRNEVRQLGEWNREWHARAKQSQPAVEPLPDMPGECAGWNEAPLATIVASFDGLKASRASSVAALNAQRSTLTASIASRRSELEARLTQARGQIPSITAQCAGDLPIGRVRATLNNLRTTLDPGRIPARDVPPQEVFDAPGRVTQALADLRAGLESAVQGLVQEGDLPDMDRTSFERLAGLLQTCLSQGDACEVAPICDTARTAKLALGRYYRENEAALRAILDEFNRRLSILGRPEVAGLECLDDARGEIGRLLAARQGGNAATWSERASAARNDASSCIQTFRERTDATRAEVLPEIEAAEEMLTSLEAMCGGSGGTAQLNALCGQMGSLETDLGTRKKALDAIAVLFQGEQPEACARIGDILDSPDLSSYAPADARTFIAGGPDDRQGWAGERCLVARDATALPLARETARLLARHDATLASLGPMASLIAAFDAYKQGDLDAAILRLRRSTGQGRIPESGRGTAYVHAALAYFLHTKRLLLQKAESDGTLIEILDRDLAREIDMAHRADETFRPPETMFRNASFRKDFDARIAEGTRRGES